MVGSFYSICRRIVYRDAIKKNGLHRVWADREGDIGVVIGWPDGREEIIYAGTVPPGRAGGRDIELGDFDRQVALLLFPNS